MTIKICDRCGKKIAFDEKVSTVEFHKNPMFDSEVSELCPVCARELDKWLSAPFKYDYPEVELG